MTENKYLVHYGVKGQSWGKRRYQNYDGSLTDLGKQHYGYLYPTALEDEDEDTKEKVKAEGLTKLLFKEIDKYAKEADVDISKWNDSVEVYLGEFLGVDTDKLSANVIQQIQNAFNQKYSKPKIRKPSQMKSNELTHHGILGQLWGRRRFQNPDGSLTIEGKLRYSKGGFMAKRKSKATTVKKEKVNKEENNKKETKKKVSEMSDAELQKYISRLTAERSALSLERDISTLSPKKVSVGEKLVKLLWNDVIAPTARDLGRQYMNDLAKSISKANAQPESKESKAKREAEYYKNKKNATNDEIQYLKNLETLKKNKS